MKILLANSTCKVGGVSTFMLSLRSALAARGHDCELFFFEHGTMEPHLPAHCRARFGSLADCLAIVGRERFDVVHANNVDWPTGISAVREAGARLVVTAHKARAGAWSYGWSRANCDAFVAVSHGLAATLQPFTDLPIQAIYNGIDLERFRPGKEPQPGARPIVAWIGRSGSPLKGFERLAAIAPHLGGSVRLWVIDGHGRAAAEAAYPAAASTLANHAERWESVQFEAMPEVYREIAASGGCVLSTSVAEGLGLAMVEAQASGCVAIASDVAGNNETVSPSHGGVRFPLDTNPELIARLVLATLSDRTQMQARRRATVAHVSRRFGLEQMVEQYLDIYAGVAVTPELRWLQRTRGRLRLSPLVHWRSYVDQRLGVGYAQFDAARRLADAGQHRLAARAGLAALRTSPTIFLKPARLARLLRALRRDGVDDDQGFVVGGHDSGGVARVDDLR